MTAGSKTGRKSCVRFCSYCCMVLYLSLFQIQAVNGLSGLISSSLPLCIDIIGQIKTGSIIKITGVPQRPAQRLIIKLGTGCSNDDKPLVINMRFSNDPTVRINVFQNGKWGAEERPSLFPFKHGQEFVLLINVQPREYKIYVNSVSLWNFTHKLPYTGISKMEVIGGPAIIRKVELTDEAQMNQSNKPLVIYPVPLLMSRAVDYPTIPFWGRFPDGLRVGNAILVQGVFPTEFVRASINFCASDCSVGPVLFHLDIRFQTSSSITDVIGAVYRNGAWRDTEENINGEFFPFHIQEPFAVLIKVQSDSYSIEVNNKHCCTYRHRLPVSQVETMAIVMGPVDIWKVKVCQPTSDASCTSVAPEPSVAPETSVAQGTSQKSSSNDQSTCRTRIYVIILLFLAYLFH